jgi:RNA polymerase sigma factor (TIGR02999 family)
MTIDHDVTELLRAWTAGDNQALDRLIPIVYDELRRVARAHLRREQAEHSLQATGLVHEVYLRFVKVDHITIANRVHFLAVAARLMRQILVDYARRKRSAKRGGDRTLVALGETAAVVKPVAVDVLALDAALEELAAFDPRQRDLVELRYFAGLTIDEAATALGISAATVEREWAAAKAWLYSRLSGSA